MKKRIKNVGIAVSLLVGLAVGVVINNFGLGLAISIALGIVFNIIGSEKGE